MAVPLFAWLILAVAIAVEVTGTLSLRASEGFTKLVPSIVVVVVYLISFALLAQVLKVLPVGFVYAIWAAVGIAAVSILGWVIFGDAVPPLGIAGIGVIIVGVVMLQLSAPSGTEASPTASISAGRTGDRDRLDRDAGSGKRNRGDLWGGKGHAGFVWRPERVRGRKYHQPLPNTLEGASASPWHKRLKNKLGPRWGIPGSLARSNALGGAAAQRARVFVFQPDSASAWDVTELPWRGCMDNDVTPSLRG